MITFGGDDDFLEMMRQRHEAQRVHCVLLDAAQLLTPRQVLQLTMVCDRLSIPVLCYGIRTDFLGEPSTTGVIHGRRSPAPAVSGHQEPSTLHAAREKSLDVVNDAENQYPRQGSNL